MNLVSKKYLFLIALVSSSGILPSSDCVNATPYFSIRSQSVDSARELAGWASDYHINLYNMCENYGSFVVTLEGTRSFRGRKIARCLFGDSLVENCNEATIGISGSEVQTRNGRDWLAENFFLAPDFESKITFRPQVSNILVDFNLYLGLDDLTEGLYFRIHAPVVNTRWKLNPREQVVVPGVLPLSAGYFGASQVNRAQLLNKALDTLTGEKSGTALISKLGYSKISPCGCTLKDTKLSDIVWAFGWNFFQDEDYHVGLNIRGAFPTGTRPDGEYLFEPVVGNGHHYELGAGLTSHLIVWRDCDCEQYVGVYLDANFTHLFKTRQCRNFDLCNSPNSRYMLAANLNVPVDGLQGSTMGGTAPLPTIGFNIPSAQFKDKYTYVANLTHSQVDVSVGVQADITFLVDYTCGGYSFDAGYNFWGRSCEKIKFKCPPLLNEENMWVLKGDASVYGFPMTVTGVSGAMSGGDPVALSASESNANIYAGTNRPCGEMLNVAEQRRNPNIDNPEFAYSGTLPLLVEVPSATFFDDNLDRQLYTSVDPVFITAASIDCDGARTKGYSHKVFANLSYTWNDREECWIPYCGVGGKVEFAQSCGSCDNRSCQNLECPTTNVNCGTTSGCDTECKTSCSSCKSCALSEWGIWIKGGISFN